MAWAERQRLSAARAIAGIALTGALSAAAFAAQDLPANAPEAALPDWLELAPTMPPSGIPAAWKAISKDAIPYPREPAAGAAPAPGTPSPGFIELRSIDGEFAGHWRFHARRANQPPHAAWRLLVPDTAPYRVQAQLMCDEAAGGCDQLRRELAWLQAPRPDSEPPVADWLRIVTAGPCQPGPVRMTAPQFPPTALREETSGTVRVRVAFNACGEVRHAAIHESSGSRELDRAAVRAARTWRVGVPEGHIGPGQGVVPIRFEVADDSLPAE